MSGKKTAGLPRQDRGWVTAADWFAGGQRIRYDPASARVLTEEQAAAPPGALRVFERVAAAEQDADEDTVWLTMLPGFPDGSYGWAQVDRMLGDGLRPRLYVEPVGQGDSDKPRDYRYSTVERADLVQALWRHHGVRRTVVVTFDYTSLALLELLRRQLERTTSGGTARPVIAAALMVNGGLFADAHTHPWQGTPLLRTPLGALGMRRAQRSPRVFDAAMHAGPPVLPQLPSRPGRARRAAVGDHPPGRSGVPPQRRGVRRRAPPPRATLGSRRDRPRPRRHGRPLRRRQRRGPLRAPADPGHPRARTPGRDPDLSRRPPDHQRAPGPPRRSHPRHRRTPRRGHPGRRQPVHPETEKERTMTRMTPLLDRNEQFARTYTPAALGIPAAQVLIVTCLDHRVDPAIVLGLQLGDAPVIRNAGGRVTQAVIDDIAYLAFLAEQLFGGQGAADTLFEVAIIHHTQCGTGFLADPGFRRQAAEATGLAEAALEASAVADPHTTVQRRR